MWLLNVETFCLEEFHAADKPEYAIFSHTWADEEVNFKDMQSLDPAQRQLFQTIGKFPSVNQIGKGYGKVLNCCRIASSQGYGHVWIDTCCINKESSAELSEAINSMYNWYESSEVCYVHLADLHVPADDLKQAGKPWIGGLRACRWFSRGWTLQELIAPSSLEFYDADWQYISNRRDIINEIAEITRIDRIVLSVEKTQKARLLHEYSVACKFSWAAQRKTTRIEDEAYALLGLFDINMPLLYGEGKRAFRRLQGVIIATTIDQSILLWNWRASLLSGLLAPSPDYFSDCGDIVPCMQQDAINTGIDVTKNGIRLICPVVGLEEGECSAVLNCRYEDDLSGPILLPFTHKNVKNLDEDLVISRRPIRDDSGNRRNFLSLNNASHSTARTSSDYPKLGSFKKLLLPDDNKLQGPKSVFDPVMNRVSVVFSFCQEFDQLFEPYIWKGKYNPQTKTLVWSSGSWFTPVESSITWLGPEETGVQLRLKRLVWSRSGQLELAAKLVPNIALRAEPAFAERCELMTDKGIVTFEVGENMKMWGEVVHIVSVSLSPLGTPTEQKGEQGSPNEREEVSVHSTSL